MVRREVSVWRDGDTWLVAARSPFESGVYFEDGWLQQIEGAAPDPAVLGAAVRAGLEHSTSRGRLPFSVRTAWKEMGLPAQALGYGTRHALERAGVLLVEVTLKQEQLRVTPMRNEGAGRGYAGDHAAPATVVERCGLDSESDAGLFVSPADASVIDSSIGTVVAQAMATSADLTGS
ncbi:hypothetical protein NF556_07055 [Ornithinimicrobium faecis]|uniref:Uncharacterized protein n=1 Tax=Ornithinimicrobium faecis TaxID=2934158 RepID=A0ABY4YXC2_9MICO|nr:hypothetical protein [Ornithinimicrobium sp. HY1793]USQ81400.1 hypothetical protein NF556_07055 [Ornithinimicrobium sp. HY1793]